MTAIAGVVHEGSVTMMADSAASYDHCLVFAESGAKILRLGAALVGVSGAIRLRQVLEVHADAPSCANAADDDPRRALVLWVNHLRQLASVYGVLRVKDGVEEASDNRLLVALKGRLFEIDSAFQVVEPALPYWSIGCGQAETRAAMYALYQQGRPGALGGWTIEAFLRRALEATAAFNAHVCPPFVSMMLDR